MANLSPPTRCRTNQCDLTIILLLIIVLIILLIILKENGSRLQLSHVKLSPGELAMATCPRPENNNPFPYSSENCYIDFTKMSR